MAESIKRLAGQAIPATTNTGVYTVPASTSAVVNVFVCNRTSSDITYRLAHTASGSSPSDGDYFVYDMTIVGNDTHEYTGIAMEAANQIVAYASASGLTVLVNGVEVS